MTIRVLIASYNRAQRTSACLHALDAAMSRAEVDYHVYLLDDGSSDDTVAMAESSGFPVTVLHGDGSFYWARSMATAEIAALEACGRGDWILWLNDDVVLDEDSIIVAKTAAESTGSRSVIVGATRDPVTGDLTYSGFSSGGWHPLSYQITTPLADRPVPTTTFNGNIVLVPSEVARALGGIDGAFAHGLADLDYGLRAHRQGFPAFIAPGTLGTCPRNPPIPTKPLLTEWREFRSVKGGGNAASTSRFMRKHAPRKKVIAQSLTVMKWWTTAIARHLHRSVTGDRA